MSSVVISGDTSGAITLAAPSVSGTNTATLPAATGTVMVSGNMPAFSAYLSSNQTFTSGAWTKIPINTEEFDTASAYDNSTNYRFTPLVAGYYQVNLSVSGIGATGAAVYGSIYKNGSNFKESGFYAGTSTGIDDFNAVVTSVISMNGTTDYLEFYGNVTGGTPLVYGGQNKTYVSATLVRSA
jgi:hypothetical protein